MRKHGSVLLYVHRNRKDGKPRTATSTLTQLLNSEAVKDHFALRPQKRGSLLGTETMGGRGRERWRFDRGYRPKKIGDTARKRSERPWTAARTMEVLRRCPVAIAQLLLHRAIAVSTVVVGRVTRTMSVALLLRNNPKRKKSNFRSPAPPPCS